MTKQETLPPHVLRLVRLCYVGLAVASVYFWRAQAWENPVLTFANIGMLVLGVLPIIRWLERNDTTYPLLEFFVLTTVPFYALPALTGHEALADYPEDVLLQAALMVIIFQCACVIGGWMVRQTYRPRPIRDLESLWRADLLPESKLGFTAITATVFTIWVGISTLSNAIPPDMIGTLRAIFFGVGVLSVFVQARMWGAGQLSPGLKVFFILNLALQVVFLSVPLLLINSISLLLTAALGYFSTARTIPWIAVVVLLPLLAVLHSGKTQMRQLYWSGAQKPPTVAELPAFFSRWVELGLNPENEKEKKREQSLTYGLMRRASLFQIVCIAVDVIPEKAPFLYGATYEIIPPQVVPRFFWPNKPSPQQSVKTLSVHLGLMTAEETESTSIGFGLITDAYANYGGLSVALLGLTLGLVFRWLAMSTEHCPTLSPAGMLRILCLVWCANTETTLVIWLSSFYQACIAVFFPIWLLKPLLVGRTSKLS